MDFKDKRSQESTEVGSDELLSDDNLHLPAYANTLVRLHALRSWLARRLKEASIEVGQATISLELQQKHEETRHHIKQHWEMIPKHTNNQRALADAYLRLSAYNEAQTLLEDCIEHTNGEHILVEYYLTLDALLENNANELQLSPWSRAIADVRQRVERVSKPG